MLSKQQADGEAYTMNKDLFDAHLQLANFRRELRAVRSHRHWQALLAAWAAVAVLITQHHSIPVWTLSLTSVAALITCILWIRWHGQRSELDQKIMFDELDEARAAAGLPALEASFSPKRWFNHGLVRMQLAVTVLLCLVLFSSIFWTPN